MANYYVNYNGSYSDTMANLTRQQYNDYVSRFQPIEKDLIGLATGNALYNEQLKRNQNVAESNLLQANQQAANSSQKYGLGDLRTKQQKTNLSNTNALSLASANNESRQAIGDLQTGLMTGGAAAKQQINSLGTGA